MRHFSEIKRETSPGNLHPTREIDQLLEPRNIVMRNGMRKIAFNLAPSRHRLIVFLALPVGNRFVRKIGDRQKSLLKLFIRPLCKRLQVLHLASQFLHLGHLGQELRRSFRQLGHFNICSLLPRPSQFGLRYRFAALFV